MDNEELLSVIEGASRLGVALDADTARRLLRFLDELLRWNQKVNLTAVTERSEAIEKHLLDALAIVPEVASSTSLLDIGAGAGLPGIPLRLVCPGLTLTLVDSVQKKVSFMKHALATLGIQTAARAYHARAAGQPEQEGLPRATVIVSRALMGLPAWVKLARSYLQPDGRIIAMLGKAPSSGELAEAQQGAALHEHQVRAYRLPFSGAERHVVTLW